MSSKGILKLLVLLSILTVLPSESIARHWVTGQATAGTGSVTITASQTGATVYVNGMQKGSVPVTVSGLELDTPHFVSIGGVVGYLSYYYTFQLSSASPTATIDAIMYPSSGALPAGVSTGAIVNMGNVWDEVYVDNVKVGIGSSTFTGFSLGAHGVKITRSGYTDYTTTVTLTSSSAIAYVYPSVSPAPATDSKPPVLAGGKPSTSLQAGTASADLQVWTDETAYCKYSTTAGKNYDSMTDAFTDSDTYHSASVSVSSGNSYNFYVRCRDSVGNTNTVDYAISFSVANPTVSPLLTSGTVTITVKSVSGTPLSGAKAEVSLPRLSYRGSAITGSDGVAVLKDVPFYTGQFTIV